MRGAPSLVRFTVQMNAAAAAAAVAIEEGCHRPTVCLFQYHMLLETYAMRVACAL